MAKSNTKPSQNHGRVFSRGNSLSVIVFHLKVLVFFSPFNRKEYYEYNFLVQPLSCCLRQWALGCSGRLFPLYLDMLQQLCFTSASGQATVAFFSEEMYVSKASSCPLGILGKEAFCKMH